MTQDQGAYAHLFRVPLEELHETAQAQLAAGLEAQRGEEADVASVRVELARKEEKLAETARLNEELRGLVEHIARVKQLATTGASDTEGSSRAATASAPDSDGGRGGQLERTIGELILDAMSSGETFKVEEITERVTAVRDVRSSSVRKAVLKLVDTGQLDKLERAHYRIKPAGARVT